jgi:hypothetical protein
MHKTDIPQHLFYVATSAFPLEVGTSCGPVAELIKQNGTPTFWPIFRHFYIKDYFGTF